MTDDLSPMLSQPPDNAPMIGGRGAKLVVDARGAYLAGNADALIRLLDESQSQRFNLGCLERLADLAYQQMAAYGHSAREQRVFDAIYAYFRDPSSQSGDVLITALAAEGYVPFDASDVQNSDYVIAMLGLTAMQKGIVYSAFSPILYHILQISGRIPYRQQIRAQLALSQWKLDSAWAVLQGKSPAPIELTTG